MIFEGRLGALMSKMTFILLGIVTLFILSCSPNAKSVLEKAEMATFIIYTFDEHGSPAGSGSGFFDKCIFEEFNS